MKNKKYIDSIILAMLFSTSVLGVLDSDITVEADQMNESVATEIKDYTTPVSANENGFNETIVEEAVTNTSESNNDETIDENSNKFIIEEKDTSAIDEAGETNVSEDAIVDSKLEIQETTENVSTETSDEDSEVSQSEKEESESSESFEDESNLSNEIVVSESETQTSVTEEINLKVKQQEEKSADIKSDSRNAGDIKDYDDEGNVVFYNSEGELYKEQFIQYDDETYYVDGNGRALIGKWLDKDDFRYYFEWNGVMLKSGTHFVYVDDNNSGGERSLPFLFNEEGHLITQEGWYEYQNNGGGYSGTVYINSDKSLATGWQTIDGNVYYFSIYEGIMSSNGINSIYNYDNDSVSLYFFDENGCLVQKSGWYQYQQQGDGEEYTYWVYMNEDSSLVTGWQTIGGYTYYFENYDGTMARNGVYFTYNSIDESAGHYLFDENGHLVQEKGWYKYQSGDSSGWMYMDSDYSIAVGWQTINGQIYYFDDGIMVSDRVLTIYSEEYSEKYYLFDENGYLVQNEGWNYIELNEYNSGWIYMNSDSSLVTGWQVINGQTYYFEKYNGIMASDGVVSIYNEEKDSYESYLFDKNGYLVQEKSWYKYQGKYFSGWMYLNEDSSLLTGWQVINGQTYYFEKYNGIMASDGVVSIYNEEKDSYESYLFDENGYLVQKKGWNYVDNEYTPGWIYMNNDYSVKIGWQTINGQTYYFDEHDGIMFSDRVSSIYNEEKDSYENYLFNKNGYLINNIGWYNRYHNPGLSSWVYVTNDSSLATGWYKIDNIDYYFDEYGTKVTNYVVSKDEKMYYVDENGVISKKSGIYDTGDLGGLYGEPIILYVKPDGTVATSEWIKYNNNWYYALDYGGLIAGNRTFKIDQKTYLFDQFGKWVNEVEGTYTISDVGSTTDIVYYLKNGLVVTNEWYQINGKWYFADELGVQARNLVLKDNHGITYVFDKNGNYSNSTGWHSFSTRYYNKETFWTYLDGNGELLINQWLQIGQDWYYFGEQGWMATTPQELSDGKSYYFDQNGKWQTNGWVVNYSNSWYYLENGVALQGWQQISGDWYYFVSNGTALVSDMLEDQGNIYIFDKTGRLTVAQPGWFSNSYGGGKVYLNSDQSLAIGWQKIDNSWYYFRKNGFMVNNGEYEIQGEKYLFDKEGRLIETNGLIYYPFGVTYYPHYVSASGEVAKNIWEQVDGNWYYFDKDGNGYTSGIYIINGVEYYFDRDGKNKDIPTNGWLSIHDTTYIEGKNNYYYIQNGKFLKNQWSQINNKWYYFDESGLMVKGTKLIDDTYYHFNEDGSWI